MLSASTRFAHTLVGTPYYLSPEMCEGAPYDERSDVWALGVVMYEAATFRLPFEGRTQVVHMYWGVGVVGCISCCLHTTCNCLYC